MKKHLFFGFVAALALSACSSDEPANNGNGGENAEGGQYLSINIVPNANNGSRAGVDQVNGDPNDNATYEEGFANENAVKKVRFYFFYNNGEAAAVKADHTNYFDFTPESSDKDMPNVEKRLNAVVVIATPDGDKLPEKIVAVINPAEEGLTAANGENAIMSLDQLRARTKDYVATATGENGAFVMMNSVFANDLATQEFNATDVTADKYAPSREAALANPVNIFVERAVAKVRVSINPTLATVGTDGQANLIALKDKEGKNITVNGKQVYLKLGKWNLTAETNEGYLSKHINLNWGVNATLFGTEYWNWAAYNRSYWAVNTENATQSWNDYNDVTGGKGYVQMNGTTRLNENVLYTNENAPQDAALTAADVQGSKVEPFTKVMIAGTLVDEEGNAIELVKYAGVYYENEDAIKTLLLKNLQENGAIYSYTTSAGVTTYTELKAEDVEFKTAVVSGQAQTGEPNSGRYYVYLQLTDTGENKHWSKSNAETQPEGALFTSADEVNKYLAVQLGHVQIYKTGMTYYYFPIRHLGDAEHTGFYGVVRNHIYDCTLNTIVGLGTPVYDPNETIYPEKPEDDETYIAARINILSWRVVPNQVDLKW